MDSILLRKHQLLNGKKLVQCRIEEPNLVLPIRGLKEAERSGTEEERKRLDKLYADLKILVSIERVDRQCNRSQGIWNANDNTIEVTAKEGNWNIFGYVKNQVQYLRPYEGLYLMEINRLELYFNSVIVSIEQGYQILLNTAGSLSLPHYIVYAKLMRCGYIVFRTKDCEECTTQNEPSTDYVWIYLNELMTNTSNTKLIRDQNYCDIKNSMNNIIENTKNAVFKEDDSNADSREWRSVKSTNKRKFESYEYSQNKKIRNDLIENCPQKFKEIFNQIDFIKLAKSNYDSIECDLKFSFNVYLPNRKNFKRSNLDQPDYRIIVWNDNREKLPSKLQMEAAYFQQTYRVPIIVVFISNFFNFNAFFYYFS